MIILLLVVCGIIGYLLGSINASVVIGKFVYKKDVREHGSKNAGLTNTLRVLGKKAAIMVLVMDILKGVIACFIGMALNPQYGALIGGFFAVVGHNWPLYFNFKGGKGILTTATILMVIDWKIALIALGVFLVVVITTKYVSLGSIIGALSIVLTSILFNNDIYFISVLTLLSLIAIYRHKANIKRLIKGEENKLNFKKGKK